MAQTSALALSSKLYFRIGEVAELVGVEPHVLRYWEREFRSIRPTKSAKGQRVYSRRDVENLLRVRELLYQEGFTIAGAKKRLQQPPETEAPPASREGEPPPTSATHSDPPVSATCSDPPASAIRSEPPENETVQSCAALRVARGHDDLLALRDEIEAFLAELDPESG
jgi:DNA-binding transcriptional MerR regulator